MSDTAVIIYKWGASISSKRGRRLSGAGSETGTGAGSVGRKASEKSEFETVLSWWSCVRRHVEDTALRNLRLENLRKAVDGLDDQGQDLIRLRYGSDLTMEEIGKIYGVSKMAVSKRLKKLHEKLRSSVT